MNQKALVISIDENVCEWLHEQLQKGTQHREVIQDLLEGIQGLKQKEYNSLIINTYETNVKSEKIEDKLKCGDLSIDGSNRSVYRKGNLIQLTPKEFDILYLLANNKGRVYSKYQIYESVWKDYYTCDDSNIMAYIRKLRKKIEPNPGEPYFILTVWGVGYKFNDNKQGIV